MNLFRTEPVAVVAAVEALLALLLAFGVGLSGEQVATIVAVTSALLGMLARQQVTPTAAPSLDDGHGDAV